jgi:phosphoesterase RecJ-like protein
MLTKIILEKHIQQAKKYVEENEYFVILTHVRPDGDAIGASLGLFHFLNDYGKDKVSVIAPNDFPPYYQWMPGAKDIVVHEKYPDFAEQLIREADVIFCMDINETKRVGKKLAPILIATEGQKVMIDHHLQPENFCHATLSYPEVSSTSELVFRFICRMGEFDLIKKPAAECIYTGMMTDTGAFTYRSNEPELYVIVAELLKKGVDKDAIYRKVYQEYSESRFRLMGYALHRKMKIYPDKHAALISLSKEELRASHYVMGDTEGFVNLPLSIGGVIFSAFIREDRECISLSFRSVGNYPCHEFAAKYFNGGGHLNASGGEFNGSLPDAIAAFEKGLAEFDPQ